MRRSLSSVLGGVTGAFIGFFIANYVLHWSAQADSLIVIDPVVYFEFVLIVFLSTMAGAFIGLFLSRTKE